MKSLSPSSGAFVIAMLVALTCRPCRAEAPAREYQVKAAFIYNFTQFVEWPGAAFSGEDAPFIVGVAGPSPLYDALSQIMSGKSVGNHAIVMTHFVSANSIGPCNLLFIPEAQDAELAAILAKLGKSPVLTIGESEGFLPAGGAIRLYLEDSKMRFALSPAAIDAASLKAGAKLMKLARIYRK